jgi:hypothetical protein
MKDRRGHVVPLAAIAREFLNRAENVAQQIKQRFPCVLAAYPPNSFSAEFLVPRIARIR